MYNVLYLYSGVCSYTTYLIEGVDFEILGININEQNTSHVWNCIFCCKFANA